MNDTYFSPRFATYLHLFLEARSLDAQEVFERSGVAFEPDREYDRPIPTRQMVGLFQTIARQIGTTGVGIEMAKAFSYESAGLAVLLMTSAPDLRASLNALVRYDVMVDSALEHRLVTSDGMLSQQISLIENEIEPPVALAEYLVAFCLQVFRSATRGHDNPVAVGFTHAAPDDLCTYSDFFGSATLRFDEPVNYITYSPEMLERRYLTANRVLHGLIIDALMMTGKDHDETRFEHLVLREVLRVARREPPTLNAVAEGLCMSARTLRRKLDAEGLAFNELRQRAMEKRARYLLETSTASLSEIAWQIGYSETSAFSRAFRSWTGMSPTQYRGLHQENPAA